MMRLLSGLAVLPFLAGVSLAAQPVPLNDKQMDTVTAGFDFVETDIHNLGSVWVSVNGPLRPANFPFTDTYLAIEGTPFPAGVQSLQVHAQFGP
jgi:hypothetical protein